MKLLEESESDYVLSVEGMEMLRDFGVEVDADPRKRRHYARQCLDWSERYHLAGRFCLQKVQVLVVRLRQEFGPLNKKNRDLRGFLNGPSSCRPTIFH